MHYGDRPAMCGLEVAKRKLADIGQHLDPEVAEMIRRGYLNDSTGGGSLQTVRRLIGTDMGRWKI